MDPLVIAGLAVGLCVVGLRYFILQMQWVNHQAFNAMLLKLVRAGNRERAVKLTKAVHMSPYGGVAKEMLLACDTLGPDSGRSLVSESLKETYEKELDRQMLRVKKWGWLSPLGVVIAGAAGGVGMSADTPHVVTFVLPGVAALLAFAAWHRVNVLRRLNVACAEELLPVLTASVMEEGVGSST